MKLDLLYEIDSPRPWETGPHPYGQRDREQRAYAETIDQIKLADKLGFNTPGSSSTTSARAARTAPRPRS